MERNLRTESTSADIFCVILLLRKKAKASFIQSHSLEIHRVCFQLLCLGSCGRGVRSFIRVRMRRIGLANREREYSDAFRGTAVKDRKCRSSASQIETFKQARRTQITPKKENQPSYLDAVCLAGQLHFIPSPAFAPQPIKELGGAPFISVKNTLAVNAP